MTAYSPVAAEASLHAQRRAPGRTALSASHRARRPGFCRHSRWVLRRGDEQAVVIDEELFEFHSVLRHPLPGFEVLVKQRQREVFKADQRDEGAGISGTLGG